MRVMLEGVRKILPFPGEAGFVTALDGIDLTLESGMRNLLKGETGSGKTSLLNILAGLACPTSGFILYDGLTRPAAGAISCGFQEPLLVPELTVLENLILPATRGRKPLPPGRPEELLDRFGLTGMFDFFPWALSCGEKKRLDLARALLLPSQLLLLDEPLAYLDEAWSSLAMELILSEAECNGTTLLIASNDRSPWPERTRIITMERGKVVDHGNH